MSVQAVVGSETKTRAHLFIAYLLRSKKVCRAAGELPTAGRRSAGWANSLQATALALQIVPSGLAGCGPVKSDSPRLRLVWSTAEHHWYKGERDAHIGGNARKKLHSNGKMALQAAASSMLCASPVSPFRVSPWCRPMCLLLCAAPPVVTNRGCTVMILILAACAWRQPAGAVIELSDVASV